jgi:Ala-tRNA(Pro) deacylase
MCFADNRKRCAGQEQICIRGSSCDLRCISERVSQNPSCTRRAVRGTTVRKGHHPGAVCIADPHVPDEITPNHVFDQELVDWHVDCHLPFTASHSSTVIRRTAMNIKAFLNEREIPFETLAHTRTGGASRLAGSVHVPGSHVAKTVLLRVNHGFRDVVAVLPANLRINPERASKLLGGAEIKFGNEEDVAIHCPDCERGVLPPFGSQYGMRTMVDQSLSQDENIVFESNTHDEAIRVKWQDFCRLENPIVGPFAELQRQTA